MFLTAIFDHALFRRSIQCIVIDLIRDNGKYLSSLLKLPDREVGDSTIADETSNLKAIDCLKRFLDRYFGIITVDLIKVDPIGPKSFQAVLEGSFHTAGREIRADFGSEKILSL